MSSGSGLRSWSDAIINAARTAENKPFYLYAYMSICSSGYGDLHMHKEDHSTSVLFLAFAHHIVIFLYTFRIDGEKRP